MCEALCDLCHASAACCDTWLLVQQAALAWQRSQRAQQAALVHVAAEAGEGLSAILNDNAMTLLGPRDDSERLHECCCALLERAARPALQRSWAIFKLPPKLE